jgi:hypothetical protein
MKKFQNRFSVVNSYKKEQAIELLSKLTLEQLLTVVNFNKKETLLNMINNSMTKSDLQTVLFQSTITDEQLLKYLQEKNMKKLTDKKTEDIVENQNNS